MARPPDHVPIGGSGNYAGEVGGASSLTELTDVTGTPGPGLSPVGDAGGDVFPLTRVTTEADLTAILDAVAATEWVDLELVNSFENFDVDHVPARYRLTLNNLVFLEGLIKRTVPLNDPDDRGTVITTLPLEAAPGMALMFPGLSSTSLSRIVVAPNGEVQWHGCEIGQDAEAFLSLCGISWSIGGAPVLIDAALGAAFGA